jgi:AmiR/NasT family two-component response regulator
MSTSSVVSSGSGALRALVADERPDTLDAAADLVRAAGHEVLACSARPERVAALAAEHDVELVVVAMHRDGPHALALVDRLNDTARCPVVLLLDDDNPDLVARALDRGVDAYADRATPGALQTAIDLAGRRFAAHEASERRSAIERAKGVLMERHDIDEKDAYRRLRAEARARRVSVAELAEAVLHTRGLLPGRRPPEP